MIDAILIDAEKKALETLERKIIECCPQIHVAGRAFSFQDARSIVMKQSPGLLFFEINMPGQSWRDWLWELYPFGFESIIVSRLKDGAFEAIRQRVAGYVLKPIQNEELILAVNNVQHRINLKEENRKNKELVRRITQQLVDHELIGVPTIDGFDFLEVEDIIRCEGMQKCTQIFTTYNSHIISSYNLGEFRKLLEPFGFFSPHKSHLINLSYVKKYRREGTIIMVDHSSVPVSRRKKSEFLNCLVHL